MEVLDNTWGWVRLVLYTLGLLVAVFNNEPRKSYQQANYECWKCTLKWKNAAKSDKDNLNVWCCLIDNLFLFRQLFFPQWKKFREWRNNIHLSQDVLLSGDYCNGHHVTLFKFVLLYWWRLWAKLFQVVKGHFKWKDLLIEEVTI